LPPHSYLRGSGLCGYDPIPYNNHKPDDGALPTCQTGRKLLKAVGA